MPKKLPEVPEPSQLKFRKTLSAPDLLKIVRNEFKKISEHRTRTIKYSLSDILMSGLAIFRLKYPSLLQFDKARNEKTIKANLKKLYGVKQAPCDTQMRQVLDPVSPEDLRPAFITIHKELQR